MLNLASALTRESKVGRAIDATMAVLSGVQALLSLLLMLRALNIQYIFQYIPVSMNPFLIDAQADRVILFIINLALLARLLVATVRNHDRILAGAPLILGVLASGISIASFSGMVVVLSAILYMIPALCLIRLRSKETRSLAPVAEAALPALLIWTAVEAGAAIFNIAHPGRYSLVPVSLETHLAALSVHFGSLLQPVAPYLIIILTFSWVCLPASRLLSRFRGVSSLNARGGASYYDLILLNLAIIAGVAVYSSRVLTNSFPLGVDVKYYFNSLEKLGSLEDVRLLILSEPRSLYILFLKSLAILLRLDGVQAIKAGSLIMIVFSSAASYFLVNQLKGDRFSAGLGSIYGSLGPMSVVGLYSGVYAQWLSLVLMFFSIGLYLKSLREGSRLALALSVVAALGSAYSHPWSGIILLAVLLTYLVVTAGSRVLSQLRVDREIVFGLAFCLTVLAAYSAAVCISPSHINSLRSAAQLSQSFGLRKTELLIDNLNFTINYFVGGFFASAPLHFTALVGAITMFSRGSDRAARVMLASWLAVCSIAFFSEQWLQWRILYMIPFGSLAGIGTAYLIHRFRGICSEPKNLRALILALVFVALTLQAVNYFQRCVSFLPMP